MTIPNTQTLVSHPVKSVTIEWLERARQRRAAREVWRAPSLVVLRSLGKALGTRWEVLLR
jgi:hypothetical protein